MRLLFIAPQSTLASGAELSRIASGNTLEVIDGLLDRAGLERALRNAQADAVHFCGHGGKSILELGDGALDKADLVAMLENLATVKFIIINACDSLATGVAIHNALHVPVIAMDAPIEDRAAVRFAETFYRTYRRNGHVGGAFDTARATLLRLFPGQGQVPVLINGDMATSAVMGECMQYVRTEIATMNEKLDVIGVTVDSLKSQQSKTLLILLILLLVAQLMTPWLTHLFAG
jgi:hypothetical protein